MDKKTVELNDCKSCLCATCAYKDTDSCIEEDVICVTPCDDCGGCGLGYGKRLAESRIECKTHITHEELAMQKSFLNRNFSTDFPIGYVFTINHSDKTVVDIRKDEDGDNEYLLDDGRWVVGKYITLSSE